MVYIVKGRADSKEIAPRLEIRDLPEEPEQWTLFILSLIEIQNPESLDGFAGHFVNIGGIHGLPYQRWPGDPASGLPPQSVPAEHLPGRLPQVIPAHTGGSATDKSNSLAAGGTKSKQPKGPVTIEKKDERFGGYCNHGSVLFPSWHRPLMMAIEQSIGEIATDLAQGFVSQYPNEEAKWATAAKKLRFPFWDWTLDNTQKGLPSLLTDPNVLITLPDSKTKSVNNPLSTFIFEPKVREGFANTWVPKPGSQGKELTMAYYKDWTRTCRYPRSEANANDDYTTLNQQLKDHYESLRRSVGHLFSFETNLENSARAWDEFSNTTFQSSPIKVTYNANSIESPHNSIHVYTGGIGHMGNPDYAGFDPMFYLHHANVDRIYALWEYIYPSYWMGAGYNDDNGDFHYFTQPGGTIGQLDKTRVDQATDLLPFRKEIDSYWTSSDVRGLLPSSTRKWYTYPPVAGVDVSRCSNADERKIHRHNLQKHFGVLAEPLPQGLIMHSPMFSEEPRSVPEGQVRIRNYRHVVIAVALVEHAFNQSYTLEVEYTTSRGVVKHGHVAVFTRGRDTGCAGCVGRRAAGGIVHGVIHIPAEHLADVLARKDDDATTVPDEINFLKKSLHARIRTANGVEYRVGQATAEPELVLDETLAPKMSLHVAYACHSSAQGIHGQTPFDLFGWEEHGEVFPGTWGMV